MNTFSREVKLENYGNVKCKGWRVLKACWPNLLQWTQSSVSWASRWSETDPILALSGDQSSVADVNSLIKLSESSLPSLPYPVIFSELCLFSVKSIFLPFLTAATFLSFPHPPYLKTCQIFSAFMFSLCNLSL